MYIEIFGVSVTDLSIYGINCYVGVSVLLSQSFLCRVIIIVVYTSGLIPWAWSINNQLILDRLSLIRYCSFFLSVIKSLAFHYITYYKVARNKYAMAMGQSFVYRRLYYGQGQFYEIGILSQPSNVILAPNRDKNLSFVLFCMLA